MSRTEQQQEQVDGQRDRHGGARLLVDALGLAEPEPPGDQPGQLELMAGQLRPRARGTHKKPSTASKTAGQSPW